jgi:AcrR family transcriptional regulator
MSRNDLSKLRPASQKAVGQKQQGKAKQPRKPDQRVRRTCERLGSALIALIQEKPINDVTVQDVLDRASVGRSTFYLHYSDKDDLLLSQLEMFLETMSTTLSVRKELSRRVAPVEEFFAHIGNQNKLYRMLGDYGYLPDFYDLAQGYFTRGIKQRLRESQRLTPSERLSKPPHPELNARAFDARALDARASALAGSLLSLLRWWLDRSEKESPQAMDDLFHRMVWNGIR